MADEHIDSPHAPGHQAKLPLGLLFTGIIIVLISGYLIVPHLYENVLNNLYLYIVTSKQMAVNNKGSAGKTNTQVVAMVGAERIFEQDIDYVYTAYSGSRDGSDRQQVLDKLCNESIILQAAMQERIISKDSMSDIYDIPEKNYGKRQQLLASVISSFPSEYAYTTWLNEKIPMYKVVITQ